MTWPPQKLHVWSGRETADGVLRLDSARYIALGLQRAMPKPGTASLTLTGQRRGLSQPPGAMCGRARCTLGRQQAIEAARAMGMPEGSWRNEEAFKPSPNCAPGKQRACSSYHEHTL